MRAELRWPLFVAHARELGVGSMLAVQLFVRDDELGALNVSSDQPAAFDDEAEHVALLFASHAAVAMIGAQEQEQMRRAMHSRERIGQATGVLIERFRLTPDQAFQLLVRASQHSNRKLVDIADELVHQGTLPPSGAGAPA
jgi:GAF domain-containing protein